MPSQPLDIEEPLFETDQLRWRRHFPWLELSEAIRLSLDPRKLLLAAIGFVVFLCFVSLTRQLPFGESSLHPAYRQDIVESLPTRDAVHPPNPFEATEIFDRYQTSPLFSRGMVVRAPIWALLTSTSFGDAAYAMTRLVGGLLIWAIFGGAIARLTALQFSGDHPVSLLGSVRYSFRHLVASIGGPLLPISGILALWCLVFIGGWIGQIPTIGPIVAGVFWGLTLLFALVATLLFVGVCFSWPIMICATAVEGTDSFDALSRGFSYVFSRPVYLVWMVALSFVIGSIAVAIVFHVEAMTIFLARQFFASSGAEIAPLAGFGGTLESFWERASSIIAQSYGICFGWTAATVMYFLLRLNVDAMSIESIYIPEDTDVDELAPLVGEPATLRREAERAADANTSESAASEEAEKPGSKPNDADGDHT